MTQPGALAAALALALAIGAACGKYGPPRRSQPEATPAAGESRPSEGEPEDRGARP
jgi:hypothetical protein